MNLLLICFLQQMLKVTPKAEGIRYLEKLGLT